MSLYAAVVLLLTLLIVASNSLILLVLWRTDMLALVNRHFFLSLTLADLCVGLFVAPFSFWTALFERWIYGAQFCLVEAYLAAIFWTASIYSLMWLSIDHYVALRKPDRYESVMTRTRSVCWVALLWVAAVCFCCPAVFGMALARYDAAAFVCLIDWSGQRAYFLTSGVLVLAPPLVAMSVANLFVLTPGYREKRAWFTQAGEGGSGPGGSARPDLYVMNVIVGVVFLVAWMPLCALQLAETLGWAGMTGGMGGEPGESEGVEGGVRTTHEAGRLEENSVSAHLHFWCVWLAIGNSFWKFPVYCVCFHDFRTGLRMLYANTICCSCVSS